MIKRYDESVSFTRIIATLFIVLCHMASHFGYIPVSQFFNVGVPMFFVISGYLYGARTIDNPGKFIYKRYLRLEIPALIWLCIVSISAFIRNVQLPKLHEAVFLLLNLQGLNFIFPSIDDLFIGPWFFTNIMACYLLLLLYLRVEEKHPKIGKMFDLAGGVPLVVFTMLALLGISTDGALAFFVGIAMKRKKLIEKPGKTHIFYFAGAFLVAVTLRLLCKRAIDGTVFYDEIIAPLTHVVLAVSIFSGIKWLFAMLPGMMNVIAGSKAAIHLDRISIYMYISHDMLFSGVVLSVFSWKLPLVAAMPLYFGLVVVFATVLWLIGEWITNKVDQGVNWLLCK